MTIILPISSVKSLQPLLCEISKLHMDASSRLIGPFKMQYYFWLVAYKVLPNISPNISIAHVFNQYNGRLPSSEPFFSFRL